MPGTVNAQWKLAFIITRSHVHTHNLYEIFKCHKGKDPFKHVSNLEREKLPFRNHSSGAHIDTNPIFCFKVSLFPPTETPVLSIYL